MSEELRKGLRGVVAAESSLSKIDGDAGRLIYRGYAIEDLARGATYEEVLYLLWNGSLPTRAELDSFKSAMAEERAVDEDVMDLVRTLATDEDGPMAALRTAVSALSAHDPDLDADPDDEAANLRKGRRITAKIPTILAAYARVRDGEDPIDPDPSLDHAANYLYMLNGEKPGDVAADVFDQALVLHADHGLNASTFSSMVTASTLADLHSAITSAVGTLSGPLHGGANQNVMEMLLEIDEDGDPVEWVEETIDGGERVPGFGHPVYTVKDPRAKILGERSQELGQATGDEKWYEYSVEIEEYLTAEKGLAPNIDFYSASTYYQLGIPIDLFTPIFAMSRVGGWIAHALEQYADNRVIRPRAKYVGPEDQEFLPIDER
ncbi:MAG: citrate synthase [Halobacteriaceae archaeon]